MKPETTLRWLACASLTLSSCVAPKLFGQHGWPMEGARNVPGAYWRQEELQGQGSQAAATNPTSDPGAALGRDARSSGRSKLDLPGSARTTPPWAPTPGMELASPNAGLTATMLEPQRAQTTRPAAASNEPPLLGWNGGVVQPQSQGTVMTQDEPLRSLEPSQAGRMHIIELYSQVLDERDALLEEVALLQKALTETRGRLDAGNKDANGLEAELERLRADTERLRLENEDLMARLTTAQIRRLEAEKILLQSRIEWYRKQEEAPGTSTGAMLRSSLPVASRENR